MNNEEFTEWLTRSITLTQKQRSECIAKLNVGSDEAGKEEIPAAIADSVPDCCPHCEHEEFVKWGFASDLQRWKCKACDKTFNALTETPLARLRHKEKWLTNAQCMLDGLSIHKTAEKSSIHPNTAFRWRHRFTLLQGKAQCEQLGGTTESDITYFYQSEKGSRKLKRKARKRGGDGIPKGYGPHLISVITLIDRYGHGAERIASNQVRRRAYELYSEHLHPDALLLTDGDLELGAAVKDMNKAAAQLKCLNHKALVGQEKSRGKKGNPIHIQTVNSVHSHLKRWMERFYGVATKYLANYIGWHRHLGEKHHKNDPNLFIQLAFKPTCLNQQLTVK